MHNFKVADIFYSYSFLKKPVLLTSDGRWYYVYSHKVAIGTENLLTDHVIKIRLIIEMKTKPRTKPSFHNTDSM